MYHFYRLLFRTQKKKQDSQQTETKQCITEYVNEQSIFLSLRLSAKLLPPTSDEEKKEEELSP